MDKFLYKIIVYLLNLEIDIIFDLYDIDKKGFITF